ncbi:transcriptional regulator [Nonomuraea wenchangensis]|uniref:transcriptional regulator n=1 Tax=Nonomuraea wenchangensis TaxID=568860 RepID=UPI00371966EC
MVGCHLTGCCHRPPRARSWRSALAAAGYVIVRKDQDKRARRTYVQLTPQGRRPATIG